MLYCYCSYGSMDFSSHAGNIDGNGHINCHGSSAKDFMRISKSIIVNLCKIESVEVVFNGMLLLRMKNGTNEYVSRTYLPHMKEYLGI